MADQKFDLRQRLRAARRALEGAEQRDAATRLAHQAMKHRWLLAARTVALYWPTDGELDPGPLIAHLRARGTRCYLPVLPPGRGRRLWFAPFDTNTSLALNRYRIPEPQVPRADRIRANLLDVVLVPCVGFDARGYRLGMGGGFYDQTLAWRRDRRWGRPRALALAYEIQRLEDVPADPWDVRLDGTITDRTIYLTHP